MNKLGIILIDNKMRKNRLKLYEHMLMKHLDTIVLRDEIINFRTNNERLKKILIKIINKNLQLYFCYYIINNNNNLSD